MSSGIIQEYVAQKALTDLDQAGVDVSQYDQYMMAWSDPDALGALLSAQGLSDDETNAFLAEAALLGELGLDAATFDTYVQEQALFKGLEEAGIPVEDWNSYADALWAGDFDTLTGLLEEAGIDADAFVEQASQDYENLYASWGFDEADYNAFQDAVFVDLLAETEGDPDAMAALLESYGYDQEQIDAFVEADGDPEAMGALLSESGIDEGAIGELSQDSGGEGDESGDSSGG